MKTYADTFKDKIIGLSKEELQNLRDSIFDKIEVYRERLAIVSNDKKVHDLTVSIRRKKFIRHFHLFLFHYFVIADDIQLDVRGNY